MWQAFNLLIGLATVMLVLSLVVTALTQLLSDVLGLRAGHLRDGVVALLGSSGLAPNEAGARFDSALKGRTVVTAEEVAALAGRAAAAGGGNLAAGFESSMQQVADEFAESSRLLVISMAILVAFGLPVDALDLFRVFSPDGMALAFPLSIAEWLERWRTVNVAGVVISALLLTFGAPLWFELLKDVLKLRGRRTE